MKNNINKIRKEKGFTQVELANACGVSRQTINAIENDKYDPSLTLAFQLAHCLGLTVDQLFLYEMRGDVKE
ncbi:helix-turn-helix transcriptional regulator [Psychrobacillus sp. NPDC096426]|uniref:helix-turn-helix transcriptional regulator n=1 Tax=Psychrobacillus sp. NPDC096426 TaxID=3364491 RepID=UPI003816749D